MQKLPRCIVILLRHSLSQKNLQSSGGMIMRREQVPSELLCGGKNLQNEAASRSNCRVADHMPGIVQVTVGNTQSATNEFRPVRARY